MTHHDDSHADDLQPVVDMLRANRPEATALELDAVKRRVRARAATGRRARSATFMKSRLAIIGMLVVGMLASTTGVGLAIDGLGGRDASVAQYGNNNGGKPNGGVLGENENNGGGNNNGGNNGGGNNNTTTPKTTLQPSRQVEAGASGGQLPFTGYLAIPVLIGGIVLLSTGLVLRRRAADDKS
jgi:hypothetical protein